jgi:hypothetical protein
MAVAKDSTADTSGDTGGMKGKHTGSYQRRFKKLKLLSPLRGESR